MLDKSLELQRSLAHVAAIVEDSDDAIIGKTLDGVIRYWNKGAQRLFGYSPEEAIGASITLIIPPELLEEEQRILATLRRGERIEHYETTRLTKDRRRVEISLTVSPVRDDSGEIIGASKIARDVTDRKRSERLLREAHADLQSRMAELARINEAAVASRALAESSLARLRESEEQLRRSEEALRTADQRKDEFLALLAHELRNPLAPIRYALAANRKADRTPEQRRWADEIMERQVAHMSRLLDDLLDVSRITRGTLELKKTHAELTSVLSAAIETARPVLDAKHHSLALDFPPEAIRLEADAVRLAQVFSNLLINAAKYTDAPGRIELSARRAGDEIVVSVRDNGIGISAEMASRLFTMFVQADAVRQRSEGGLGVGLALVRGIVALHGGSVHAHSEGPGRGSEFVVKLPASEPAVEIPQLGSVEDSAAGIGLRILVADDNRDAADTCAALLELQGHRVQTAYCGREALELAESFRPHAALLDIGLPDLSGYLVADHIRTSSWGRHTLLVAVTGWGQIEDRRRAYEAGFDHHLAKPVAAEAIESVLRMAGGRAGESEKAAG